MILHTIVDPEIIWRKEAAPPNILEIQWKGIPMEVMEKDEKTVVISRILSTNLNHYLDPELQPGMEIGYGLKSRD